MTDKKAILLHVRKADLRDSRVSNIFRYNTIYIDINFIIQYELKITSIPDLFPAYCYEMYSVYRWKP